MDVHVRKHRHLRVAWIHATHVAAQRHPFALRITGVGEVVISLWIFAERHIVLRRRECQWRAATPAPDEFRRQQLALIVGLTVLLQEPVERSNPRLVFSQTNVGAVAAQHVWLRHRKRHTALTWIAEDELPHFDRLPLTGKRIDATALDGGLSDAVFISERVETARLSAEVLNQQDGDARKTLILLPRRLHGAAPLLFGVADDADLDVNLSATERPVPVLRIVCSVVTKLLSTRSHSHSKCFRKALQGVFRQAQRHQPRIADRNRDPRVFGIPPIGGRTDVRRESPQELTAAVRIVDVQEKVRAKVRLRTIAQNSSLATVLRYRPEPYFGAHL